MVEDQDTQAEWFDLWRAFLRREMTAEAIVDASLRLVGEGYGQDAVDTLRSAREDLLALTKLDANPRVMIGIVLSMGDYRMFRGLFGAHVSERDAELTKLSSPRYWTTILSKLEAAKGPLRAFMETGVYGRVTETPLHELDTHVLPFSRICQEVQRVDSAVSTLIDSIRDLRLAQADTALEDLGTAVRIKRTAGKRGRKKGSGAPRPGDRALLELDRYLRVRAGGPHTREIARLLHFAGLENFPGVLKQSEATEATERVAWDEVDLIRKRIEHLASDTEFLASAMLGLSFLESDYETREPIAFDGYMWVPF